MGKSATHNTPAIEIVGRTLVVQCRGPWGDLMQLGVEAAFREHSTRATSSRVLLVIDSLGPEFECYFSSTVPLFHWNMRKLSASYVINAQGPGLLWAIETTACFASPLSRLGKSAELPPSFASDLAMMRLCNMKRPNVNPFTWWTLLRHTLNGEQCEATGVVDDLASDHLQVLSYLEGNIA